MYIFIKQFQKKKNNQKDEQKYKIKAFNKQIICKRRYTTNNNEKHNEQETTEKSNGKHK